MSDQEGELTAVRLPNWVGDVCMALPTLSALCAARRCRLFARGWAVDLLCAMGWDVVKLPSGLRAAAAVVRSSAAQDGMLLTNSFGSALQFRLAGIRATGYRGHWRSWLLGRAIAPLAGQHEVQRFWNLGHAHLHTELTVPLAPPRLGLRVHERHRSQAQAARVAAAVTGPYAVLCPLATGLAHGHSKIWPSFPLLCRGLIEQGVQVISVPGPGEEAASAAALPGAIALAGLGLGAYAAVLADARFVVANDSGPMHLAAAVDAPVIGLFGVSDPHRTSPWGVHARYLGQATAWPSLPEVITAIERLGD